MYNEKNYISINIYYINIMIENLNCKSYKFSKVIMTLKF